jgi:hypothetical protein
LTSLRIEFFQLCKVVVVQVVKIVKLGRANTVNPLTLYQIEAGYFNITSLTPTPDETVARSSFP